MNRGLASAAQTLASYGRGPDTMLAHITPSEAQFIDQIQGGRRTNPHTGLPEYGLFGKVLKAAVRIGATVGGFVLSGGNPAAAAAANAAAVKLTGGSWKQAATSAAITGLTAGVGNAATGPSMWSSEALKQSAGAGTAAGLGSAATTAASAGPGMIGHYLTGAGSGAALGGAGAGLAGAAAPTALSSALSGIGGMTGAGVGLAALSGAPLSSGGGDEMQEPTTPAGFGGNINLNVEPLNRQYIPNPNPGSSKEHKYFDRVNPAPVYLEPMEKQDRLEDEFMARGGKPRRVSRAAARGVIRGAGTETSDSIPAMLSDGEHVWDAATVRMAGGHSAIEKIKQRVRARAGMRNPSKPPAFGGA